MEEIVLQLILSLLLFLVRAQEVRIVGLERNSPQKNSLTLKSGEEGV